jgi:DNA-binding CsgD family transcriptional regulator
VQRTLELSKIFWNASIEDLKNGYIQDKDSFTCLLCGERIEKGIIYPYENKLYEAERYMRIHIENAHISVFNYILSMDKKLTGLTEHQKKLLSLFYEGKSDKEIQKELGIGSTSTIRHHRFALKEKERQAKIFLALMELLKEKDQHAPAFVPVHKTATMVDERYNVTQEEQEQIIQKYFSNGVLTKFPNKEKQRLIILREIANRLKPDNHYEEKELNEILKGIYEDYALIRRYLVDYGFLNRKSDGSSYWLNK